MEKDGQGKIDYRFRIMYALGMIFIVAGHSEGGGVSLFYDWFPPYSFHFGMFVFCSGYLYKESSADHPGAYILKKLKRMILPMYLWNFFYAGVVLLSRRAGFTIGLDPSFRTLFILPNEIKNYNALKKPLFLPD